jgi:hypothetical protein
MTVLDVRNYSLWSRDPSTPPCPDWIVVMILELAVPEDRREEFHGDLIEEWDRIRRGSDLVGARRWLWGQAIGSIVPILGWRLRRSMQILGRERGVVWGIWLASISYLLPAILVAWLLDLLGIVRGSLTIDSVRGRRRIGLAAVARRVRIERYGWEGDLAAGGATVLDHRRNDIEATREALLRGPDGELVLICGCPPTSRIYSLPGTTRDARHVAEGDCDVLRAPIGEAVAALRRVVREADVRQFLGPLIRVRGPVTITHPEHGDRTPPGQACHLVNYQRAWCPEPRSRQGWLNRQLE